MTPRPFILAAFFATSLSVSAQVALWNFNSPTPDANTGTGTTNPVFGTGTLSVIGGVAAPTFSSGDANGGSSDLSTGDDSGLQTTGYPAQGAADLSAGVQFNISTVGFSVSSFTFDLRTSNTSSRFFTVTYSLDGTNFIPSGTVFSSPAGDTWNNLSTVDFSGIAGASDNPNFAVRIVSTFAPATSTYVAASNGTPATYAGGTYRFDMVTLNGSSIPEPSTVILGLVGLGGLMALRRRRSA